MAAAHEAPSPEGALGLVLERIEAAGVELREAGSDRYRGDCVACGGEDRMTVRLDLQGSVWIDCYSATCDEQDRHQALNLTRADLRPVTSKEPARGRVTFASQVKA